MLIQYSFSIYIQPQGERPLFKNHAPIQYTKNKKQQPLHLLHLKIQNGKKWNQKEWKEEKKQTIEKINFLERKNTWSVIWVKTRNPPHSPSLRFVQRKEWDHSFCIFSPSLSLSAGLSLLQIVRTPLPKPEDNLFLYQFCLCLVSH